ncbi:DUF5518 domain-containing protein [Haloarcula marismortui]|jgi:hypothetical protein|uniref:Uncharacterized protein n=2 Tax=Haloarcula marismortui TaxID=2238 RepID=Q5V0I0_HALMA|nr:unknown [Haloarcula marismortui ATCC 43049]EMA20304.1 hypothetical protein C435_07020 [Haloarcula californiae ATCC 33799]QCP91674.1 hypothetical protein E6P14_12730 [Haloarcula marismortui ATCC 43049]
MVVSSGVWFFISAVNHPAMSLQFELSKTWKCALIGGVIPAAFTVVDVLRSASNITFQGLFLGGVVAGYLVKRHGGVGTAAGIRAGLIGGVPALWSLKELLVAIPTIPNPLWFRVVGVGLALVVGVLLLGLPMAVGGLAGRFGGWLAEQQGHPRVPTAGS